MARPRTGRMKPCLNCGKGFWCSPFRYNPANGMEKKYCSKPCMWRHKFLDDPDAFLWARVDKNHPSGCWVYTGATDRRGYGRPAHQTKRYYAHRRSYEVHKGPIPPGMLVLHKCDNPPCCNPDHLFLGTDADNMRDKSLKERTHDAQLSLAQVREIREALKENRYGIQRDLAKKYGVKRGVINDIKMGHTYRVASQQCAASSGSISTKEQP